MGILFDWKRFLLRRNLRKNLIKNLASSFCALIGFSILLLSIGYFSGYERALSNQGKEALDYGVFTLSEKRKVSMGDSPLKLVETRRPNLESCIDAFGKEGIEYGLCFSYFFPESSIISFGEESSDLISLCPVFSFESCEVKTNSLLKGHIPLEETIDVCLVNEAFANAYPDTELGNVLSFSKSYSFAEDKEKRVFEYRMTIDGVVKDFPFMSTPKVYYSYLGLEAFFMRQKAFSDNVCSLVEQADASSAYGSYSRYAFFLTDEGVAKIPPSFLSAKEGLCAFGTTYTAMESFFVLSKSFSSSLILFSFVSLSGLTIVLAMNNYANFTSRKKENAILLALGAKRRDIEKLYVAEAVLVCFVSFLLSLIVSFPLSALANRFFEWKFGLRGLVAIPYFSWFGLPLTLEVTLALFAFSIALISKVPFAFIKTNDLMEELRDE